MFLYRQTSLQESRPILPSDWSCWQHCMRQAFLYQALPAFFYPSLLWHHHAQARHNRPYPPGPGDKSNYSRAIGKGVHPGVCRGSDSRGAQKHAAEHSRQGDTAKGPAQDWSNHQPNGGQVPQRTGAGLSWSYAPNYQGQIRKEGAPVLGMQGHLSRQHPNLNHDISEAVRVAQVQLQCWLQTAIGWLSASVRRINPIRLGGWECRPVSLRLFSCGHRWGWQVHV